MLNTDCRLRMRRLAIAATALIGITSAGAQTIAPRDKWADSARVEIETANALGEEASTSGNARVALISPRPDDRLQPAARHDARTALRECDGSRARARPE